jgi:hypothetical protein
MSSIPPTSIMTANNDDMFQAETGMDDEDDDDDGALLLPPSVWSPLLP